MSDLKLSQESIPHIFIHHPEINVTTSYSTSNIAGADANSPNRTKTASGADSALQALLFGICLAPFTVCTVCRDIVVTSTGYRTSPASCVVVAKVSEVLAKTFRKHDSRRTESR